ncbi:MAG TPA: FAD-dependent oxidoreductase [Candidatus Acidoferrales bacterium]|nr:FAD-dependent oxidoreductase [Candidatus Acidoferrales bacterium]
MGAGLGGVAAALRAARLGCRVCLIEETGWPGGQISTQGVSALDEHAYIETFGGTRGYYELREALRTHYRDRYALSPEALRNPLFNPGNAWVSRLAFEPRAGAAVVEAMLAQPRASGALRVFYHTRAVAADVSGDRITSVLAQRLDIGSAVRFQTAFVLDATDLGDLFPLTGTAYAVGAESQAEAGEPSAPEAADPSCLQHFTFPIAVELCPGEVHTISQPEGYARNRVEQPYSFTYHPWDPAARVYRMFDTAPGTYGAFWTYRRALDARNFADPRIPHDISIINWTGNDFRGGMVMDRPSDERAAPYRQARLLSLGFLFWLQTEAPRDDGGVGYPELRPRPDVMGSTDGLSQVPYIREGRRLKARARIREQDISAASQPGARAARFDDAAGIGFYPIDLHGCGVRTVSIPTRPFQIPLGALIPERTVNLLPAAKNIGTTHITNGAYRLHPVEWAVGEAAAVLAVFCLRAGASPQQVHAQPDLVRRLQCLLLDEGIPLYWYDDVPLGHPAFAAAQLLAIDGAWEEDAQSLHFRPDDTLTPEEGRRIIARAATRIRRWRGPGAAGLDEGALRPAAEDATEPLTKAAATTLIAAAMPGATLAGQTGTGGTGAISRGDLAVWLGALVRAAIEEGGSEG